jgi:hypothetical protein
MSIEFPPPASEAKIREIAEEVVDEALEDFEVPDNNIPEPRLISSNATLSEADQKAGTLIVDATSDVDITVPPNLPAGRSVAVYQAGPGVARFIPGMGVSLGGPRDHLLQTSGLSSTAFLTRLNNLRWGVGGALATGLVKPIVNFGAFSVSENSPNGTLVGRVSITGGLPTSVTITAGNSDTKFAINLDGDITVIGAIDYETLNVYSLEVTAVNAAGSSTANQTVNITDVAEGGIPVLPPITITPTYVQYRVGSEPQTLVDLSAPGNGTTRTIDPVDNRVSFNTAKTKVVPGVDATTAADITYTVRDENPNTNPTFRTATFTVSVLAAQQPGVERSIGTRPIGGTGNAAGTVDSFAETFEKGTVLSTDTFGIKQNGTVIACDYRPSTYWDDGSVCVGLFAYEPLAMADGVVQNLELIANMSNRPTAANLTIGAKIAGRSAQAIITPQGKSPITVDLLSNLETAPWRSGPLLVEHRHRTTLAANAVGSAGVRVISDVQVTKDNLLSVDLRVANDQIIPGDKTSTGTIVYSLRVLIDGAEMFNASNIRMTRYQSFLRRFARKPDGTNPPRPFTIPEAVRASKSGFVPNADKQYGIAASWLNEVKGYLTRTDWNTPMSSRAIATYMPNTGGRTDIGFMPNWNFCLLAVPDKSLYKVTVDVAEAAATIPWNYWLPNGGKNGTGSYINCIDTMLQLDSRVDDYPQMEDNGWTVDSAHNPEASSMGYYVTARRQFGDNLTAQAGWTVNGLWPGNRGENLNLETGEGVNLIRGDQIRSGAWGSRNVYRASYLVQASEQPHDDYFRRVFNGNMNYVINNMNTWEAQTGELKGIWPQYAYDNDKAYPPWMHDYFMTVLVGAALGGNEKAKTVCAWMANFTAERFQQRASWNRNNGVAFLLYACSSVNDFRTFKKTWAEVDAYTKSIVLNVGQNPDNQGADRGSNPNQSYNTTGPSIVYPAHLNVVLAAMYPEDPRFPRAAEYLLNAGYNILNPASYSGDPESSISTFALDVDHTRANVRPVVKPNQTFTVSSGKKTAVVKTTGAYPTAFVLSGADANKWKIDNAGVIEPTSIIDGTAQPVHNLAVVATSKFATQSSLAVPVTINVSGTVTPGSEQDQPPVITANQSYSVSRGAPVGTKVADILYSGPAASSGIVRNADGSANTEFEIANGDDLITKIVLTSAATGVRDLRISLTNANGTSAERSVSVTLTAVAQPGTSIFGTTATTYRGGTSMNRRMVSNYTGPLFRARRADNVEQDFGFNSATGDIDRAAFNTWKGSQAAYRKIGYVQDGSTNHFANMNAATQFEIKDDGTNLYLDSGQSTGRFEKTPIINIDSLNLGAIAAVRVEDFRFNGRILSAIRDGDEGDMGLPDTAALVMWETTKISVRSNDDGNGNEELRTSDFTDQPNKMVIGSSYRENEVAIGLMGTYLATGSYVFKTKFGQIIFRLGFPGNNEHDQMIGRIYEVAIFGATTQADMAKIRDNMKTRYGTV